MAEFASTIAQIGLLVIILTAMGTIANEYKHGTAYLTLSKPVSRLAFVTAKFTAGALTILVSLIVSALICYAYSVWLIGPLAFSGFLMQTGLTALFLLFVLALTVFFSSIFKNSLAAGGLSLGVIILLALIASLPKIGNYLPGKLTGWSLDVLDGVSTPYWWALGITVVLIVLAVYFAQMILKKREA
jgi:ABC-2 type transport system permease protein